MFNSAQRNFSFTVKKISVFWVPASVCNLLYAENSICRLEGTSVCLVWPSKSGVVFKAGLLRAVSSSVLNISENRDSTASLGTCSSAWPLSQVIFILSSKWNIPCYNLCLLLLDFAEVLFWEESGFNFCIVLFSWLQAAFTDLRLLQAWAESGAHPFLHTVCHSPLTTRVSDQLHFVQTREKHQEVCY